MGTYRPYLESEWRTLVMDPTSPRRLVTFLGLFRWWLVTYPDAKSTLIHRSLFFISRIKHRIRTFLFGLGLQWFLVPLVRRLYFYTKICLYIHVHFCDLFFSLFLLCCFWRSVILWRFRLSFVCFFWFDSTCRLF